MRAAAFVLVIAPWLAACSSDESDAGTQGGSAGSAGSGGSAAGGKGGTGTGGTSAGGSGGTGGTSAGGTGGSAGSGGASGSDASGGTGGDAGASGASGAAGAAPTACGKPKPGPTNTGVPPGTALTSSGSITVDEDGAIVEALEIAGTITVLANDVTIRKVRITTGDYYPIRYFDEDNTGLLVEDTEIIGTSGNVTSGIAFANYTARRVNVHGMADGFKADSNVLIEDSWIHDLSNGQGEHNDGVQSTGGAGVTLRHNTISGASNAAVQTGDENGATVDLSIECNWLSGGGWTLNIRGSGATVPQNTRIIDNRFGRDHGYGPWTLDDPSPTVSGNVYDDDDEPIP
jgi:hypothetical protein